MIIRKCVVKLSFLSYLNIIKRDVVWERGVKGLVNIFLRGNIFRY